MVLDNKLCQGQLRYIYPLDKFRVKYPDIEPVYWRDANVGEWALTDDSGVCEILTRKTYIGISGMPQTILKTITGTYVVEGTVDMDNVVKRYPHHMVRKNGGSLDLSDYVNRTRREGLTKGDRLYAQQIMNKTPEETLEDVYRKAFPKAKSEKYIKMQATRLYKTKRIQTVINEHIQKTLEDKKITFGQLLDWMKTMMDDERLTMQGTTVIPASVKLGIVNKLADWLGVQSETKQIEDRSWFAQQGRIDEGEFKKIGQKQKTIITKTEVGE